MWRLRKKKMKIKITAIQIVIIAISLFTTNVTFGQGCETLLMNGVFNTFNYSSGNYSSAEWHNYWCNGTVESVSSSSSGGAALNLGIAKISLGMSFSDAQEFQKVYKSIYCGSNTGGTINISTNSVIQKVADPNILAAYVKCKEIENGGLQVNLSIRPEDKKVFVVDVKYTKAWGNVSGPKVKNVKFVPNVISEQHGTLQDGIGLKTGITYSLICERSTDIPLTVYIETEVGTFIADLPAFIPPPTDQEKIMSAMPRGTIFGWFDPNKIPRGWVICDGGNGTPDLIERSPIGTSLTAGNLGSIVGEKEYKLSFSGTTGFEGKRRDKRDGNGMEGEGNECMFHTHSFSGTTDSKSLLPPSTRIIFIMKI